MLMHELTMPGFVQQRRQVEAAILPIGVMEQHGPHLPLGLDAMHALALAQAAAAIEPCFVLPPLFYGICRSTANHPGTIGISGDALRAVLHDIGQGVWSQGIRCLCLLTGHAGGTHQSALIEAGERLLTSTGLQVATVCVLDLLAEARPILQCPGDSHAGEVETSLAMHLWPGLVQGSAAEEYPSFPRFRLVRDKRAHWPGGVWGDPTKASAEKGRLILEAEAKALAALVAELLAAAQEGA
ncbi:Creatininase [Desulfarculus baarsii DSM 2075]|uniref:Creatininase n=1 Tax=Desulfarculus baarsii (strain ATCC 33931 / DSM 2075 / LMG 7858 / VKM B-1802 / 2st14) TaxID=644282 RepID=E1QLU4_DESB2|nr:creatininase family protein [Desulfarculus baarsii]ADK86529.1 Creatininase [Desulfarculus baarsii DSM 2075]